jgi:hypothetical protein
LVLGEQALHTRRGTQDEHAEQLHHLASLMRLPFVSVSVIPADAQRYAIASIGFWVFDTNVVAPPASRRGRFRDGIAPPVALKTGCGGPIGGTDAADTGEGSVRGVVPERSRGRRLR